MKEDQDYLAQLGELKSKSYLTLAQNLSEAVKKRAKRRPEGLDLPLGGESILRFVPGRWTVWAGPTHHGKALALDTPLPTPDGWTTMGDVKVGDTLFDQDGKPCRVIGVTDVMHNRECYDVEFSDGSVITADAEHLWETTTTWGTTPKVRTTAEIAKTLYCRRGPRHRIPVTKPLETATTDLPLDPYVLGVWLGDGTSTDPRISCGDRDVDEMRDILRACGIETTAKRQRTCWNVGMRLADVKPWADGGLLHILRGLDVLKNKHIPAIYLRSDQKQRLSLLQGLMDTDGSVNIKHRTCEFCSTNQRLAENVHELACSLGIKARLLSAEPSHARLDNGEKLDGEPKHRVIFSTTQQVFRLSRKRESLPKSLSRRPLNRTIVACRPRESVPVKCISVDSPRNLYLAGKSMIPTHNTQFLRFLMTHAMHKGFKILFASLEDDPEDIVYEFCCMVLGTRNLTDPRIDAVMDWLEDRLTIFNHTGFVDPNVMLGAVIYAAKEYGVKHAVIDSLMMMSIRKDDYEGQKEFGMQLNRVVKQYDLHLHLIVHPRKTENSDVLMDLNDIQGASELAALSHLAVTLQRMPRNEKNRASWGLLGRTDLGTDAHSVMRVWKQRGDWNRTGTVEMAYLPKYRQWSMHSDSGPRRFMSIGMYRELGLPSPGSNPYDDPFDYDPPQQSAF